MDQNSYSRKLCIKQANNNLQAEIYVVNVQVQIWHIEKKSITHHTSCFKEKPCTRQVTYRLKTRGMNEYTWRRGHTITDHISCSRKQTMHPIRK